MKFKHFFVCAAMFALVIGSPIFAGDDADNNDDASYFLMLEGAFTNATGGGGMYTALTDDSGYPIGTLRSVEMDTAIAPRIGFGLKSGSGWWVVSFSSWDDDSDEMLTAESPNYLWDVLYHADEAWDDYEGSVSALRSVEANTIDITYNRKLFSDDKFSGSWLFGLRYAGLDHDMDVLYDYPSNIETHTVNLESEASGFGLVGGAHGKLMLTDNWFLTGGFEYALLSGEVESHTLMVEDYDGDITTDADIVFEEDRTFSMLSAQVSLMWHPTKSMYYWLGYELTKWNDVVDTNLFPDDVSEGFIQTDTTGIDFNGFKIGVGFTF